MQVRDIMTENPTCCSPETSIREAAKLMADNDCGEIPVVDHRGQPVGTITDRDIACRCVAEGRSPETPVREAMSSPVITVTAETSLEDCCRTMEENQIRRVPVVDQSGSCCGIVSQADVALRASKDRTAEIVHEVSEPTREPSAVNC